MFGSRTLKFRRSLSSVSDLVDLAQEALTDSLADDYKAEFGFIDHIVPVYDDSLEDSLRQSLVEAIFRDDSGVDVLCQTILSTMRAIEQSASFDSPNLDPQTATLFSRFHCS